MNISINQLKYFLVVLALFLIIDIPMITTINGPMYQTQFKRINNSEIKVGTHTWISAGFAYILLALGIYWFIVRVHVNEPNPDYIKILIDGMLLGLIIYGVYNGTNGATINEWGTKEFIVDTVWGTTLSGILAISSIFLIKKFSL